MFWKREETVSVADHKAALDELKTKMVSVADHKAALDELNTKKEKHFHALCEELNSASYEYKKAELMADMAKESVIIWGGLLGIAIANAGLKIYNATKGA